MEKWQDAVSTSLYTLLQKPRLGLISDVDGTLSPIVDTPDAAQVTPRSKALLATLTNHLELVAVISGRSAADVQARVGVPGVVCVGNHGMERWHNGGVEISPDVIGYRPAMQAVVEALQHQVQPGVLVEDKGVTISVHYRKAPDPEAAARQLQPVVESLSSRHGLRVFAGRMIYEIRPPIEIHKGSALRDLIKEYALSGAVYIGDDTTDVDALKMARSLRQQGQCYALGVAVASAETPSPVLENSDLVTEGISEVESFLDWLARARSASSN